MAWKVSYKSSFLRTFKKLDKKLQNEILDIADKIQSGNEGVPLHYNWSNFFSWHFNRKPEYRLVYIKYHCLQKTGDKLECQFDDIEHSTDELKACDGLIEFVLIDTREEFNKIYKKAKKDIENYWR